MNELAGKVSVIVPVYNAGQYLREALESVIGQNDPDWELLLVDNGSTDGSLALCREYEKKYRNIHVFQEQRKGCANARNLGMKHANGAYIMFMDADDYLPDIAILTKLRAQIEQAQADIAICNYERLWDGRLLPAASHQSFSGLDRESEDFRFRGFFSDGHLSYVWGRVYRRSFLAQHAIQFMDLSYAEDKMFNLQCYLCQAKYAFIEDTGYVYRRNPQSISYQYKPDSMAGWMSLTYRLKTLIEAGGHPQSYMGMVWYQIFFASFFDAKMEYMEHQRSLRAVRATLSAYAKEGLAKQSFRGLFFSRQIHGLSQSLWKLMLRGFSFGMTCHLFGPLSLGIKLLIDLRIDERLSDTGMRE